MYDFFTFSACSADLNSGCEGWAAVGECEKNPSWMIPNCCISCKYHKAPKGTNIIHSIIHSFVRWFVGSLVRLLVRSFVCSLFVRSIDLSFVHSFVRSLMLWSVFLLKNVLVKGFLKASNASAKKENNNNNNLNPPPYHGMDLSSAAPNPNPTRFVSSQLFCLLPVGILYLLFSFQSVCFPCFSDMPGN